MGTRVLISAGWYQPDRDSQHVQRVCGGDLTAAVDIGGNEIERPGPGIETHGKAQDIERVGCGDRSVPGGVKPRQQERALGGGRQGEAALRIGLRDEGCAVGRDQRDGGLGQPVTGAIDNLGRVTERGGPVRVLRGAGGCHRRPCRHR